MVTKNIKTHYLAKGDGQILLAATVSITSGLRVLRVESGPFDPLGGDIGKYIAVTGAGDGGNAGSNTLLAKIVAPFIDAQHVNIDTAATHTLTNSTQKVEWGTDDVPAFMAFNADFQGASGVQLNCPGPLARYCLVTGATGTLSGPSAAPWKGIKGLRVLASDGDSTAIFTDLLGCGNGFFWWGAPAAAVQNHPGYSSKIATVSAGSTKVTLLNPSEISFFAGLEGKRVQLQGFEVQGPGTAPSNPYFYEYPTIAISGINVGAAEITFTGPIKWGYKQTWPEWVTGSGLVGVDPNSGVLPSGAARLFVLNDLQAPANGSWDCAFIFEGLGIELNLGPGGAPFIQPIGRSITWKGGYFTNVVPIMSQNEDYVIDGTDLTNSNQGECDKQVVNVTIKNLSAHGYFCQSPSPDTMTFDNYHGIAIANGTGKSVIFNNSIIDTNMVVGSNSWGSRQLELRATNTAFNGAPAFSIGGVREDDIAGAGAYTMSCGVIQRSKAGGSGVPPQWAVPGNWCYWASRFSANAIFQVLDVWERAGTLFIQTSLTGGFPPATQIAGTFAIQTLAAPVMKLVGCTGKTAAAWSLAPTGNPKNSYWQSTYTTNIGTGEPVIPMIGKLVTATINVTAPFSTGTLNFNTPFVIQISDNSVPSWAPVVDLTQVSKRVISAAGVSGTAGTDSGLGLPGDKIVWLVDDQITPQMSGVTGSGSVTIEIITDQGLGLRCSFG